MLTPAKQAVKRATRALVVAVGGQEACAGFARVHRHQSYSSYGNVACEADWMPADVIADLEAVTVGTPGYPVLTRELARQAGFALVPLPAVRCEPVSWNEHLARVAKETGDVVSQLARDCAVLVTRNGDTAAAQLRLRGEVAEAQQRLAELDAALALEA